MRSRIDWLDIGLQVAGFVLIFVVLSLVPWPFILKPLLALALAPVLGFATNRIRRAIRRRREEPKRMRVISVETVDD